MQRKSILAQYNTHQESWEGLIYHIRVCATRLVETGAEFEEERSYAEPTIHGIYGSAIESI